LRGQSNVLSTVILTSLLMIVIIGVTAYALFVIEGSVEQAEYVRVKEVAINLGQAAVTSVCGGYAAVFTLPMRTCGIEFNNTYLTMNVSLIINNTYVVNYTIGNVTEVLFPCGKYAPKPLSEVVDYGSNSYVVSSPLYVPLVTEKYSVSMGRPLIKLNMSRVVANLKKVLVNGLTYYILNIEAYNLSYRVVTSSGRLSIKCLGVKSINLYSTYLTSQARVSVAVTLYRGGSVIKTYIKELGTINSVPTALNASLTVYNVVVEVG